MATPITIDGATFPSMHVTSIKRSFAVTDGENAGRVLTGRMERDLIGTFYNYAVTIDPDEATPADYDSFYDIISAPVDSHVLVLPYGQSTLTFEAYVTNGQDELLAMYDDGNRWGELSFNFIAMEPQRYVS